MLSKQRKNKPGLEVFFHEIASCGQHVAFLPPACLWRKKTFPERADGKSWGQTLGLSPQRFAPEMKHKNVWFCLHLCRKQSGAPGCLEMETCRKQKGISFPCVLTCTAALLRVWVSALRVAGQRLYPDQLG